MGPEPADMVCTLLSELLPIEEGFANLRLRTVPEDPPPGASPALASSGGVTRDTWGVFVAMELTAPWREREYPGRPVMRRTMTDTIGLVPAAALGDLPRVEAYLRGWVSAVRKVLRSISEASPHGILLFRLAIPTVLELKLGSSADRFERALLAPSRLGKYVPPDRSLLSQDAVDWVYQLLGECLPAPGGLFSVRVADPIEPVSSRFPSRGGVYGVPEGLRVALALSSYQRPGGLVRDTKQQDIFLLPLAALTDPERLEACLRGWGDALTQLFATSDPEALECLMPHDLSFERALLRRRTKTREEFRDALLLHWNRRWTLR
jgi:hypothetical protein